MFLRVWFLCTQGQGHQAMKLEPLFEYGGYVRGVESETLLDLHIEVRAVHHKDHHRGHDELGGRLSVC